MKKYTLLLNGKDYDTGQYEYFPYVDKLVSDFTSTKKIIRALKEGHLPPETPEYIFASFCTGGDDLNTIAVKSAHQAFEVFRDFSLSRRKKIFFDMHRLLMEKRDELIRLLIIEGHPRKLAEWEFQGMSIGSSPATIEFYCRQVQMEVGRKDDEALYLARKPDGVVCMNPPGNASASSSYNGILAFMTGNTVIVRPSFHSPISTIFLWKEIVHRALADNGAPPGTVNVIAGNSASVLKTWIEDPHVSDIIHFGESSKGMVIGSKIFHAGKKPILELSGNDFMLIWKDAHLNKVAESLIDGFMGSTQVCMVPKIALIHHAVYDQFESLFLKRVQSLKVGLPTDPDTILSPVGKIPLFYSFLNDALEKGARLLYGGQRINYLGIEDSDGCYIRPAVLKIGHIKNALSMRCMQEEIFFPLMPLIVMRGSDEDVFHDMVSTVDSHQFGIRLSLWCRSPKYTRKFVKQVNNCGMLRINSRHIKFSYYLSTHGGTRKSGGPFGEMNYFWQKTSHLQGVVRTVR